MLHAYRLLSRAHRNEPDSLWEWHQPWIDHLLWHARTFGQQVVQRYFAIWQALEQANTQLWERPMPPLAVREEHTLLIPAALDQVLSAYVHVIMEELRTLLTDVTGWKGDAQDIVINEWTIAQRGGIPHLPHRWERVRMAYHNLLLELRDVLGLDFAAHKPLRLLTGRE